MCCLLSAQSPHRPLSGCRRDMSEAVWCPVSFAVGHNRVGHTVRLCQLVGIGAFGGCEWSAVGHEQGCVLDRSRRFPPIVDLIFTLSTMPLSMRATRFQILRVRAVPLQFLQPSGPVGRGAGARIRREIAAAFRLCLHSIRSCRRSETVHARQTCWRRCLHWGPTW